MKTIYTYLREILSRCLIIYLLYIVYDFRVGHHSTSDDSSAYRDLSDLAKWITTENPIGKLRLFMESKYWWNQDMENAWISDAKKQVLNTMKESEKTLKPNWREMFTDVYYDMPDHIQ